MNDIPLASQTMFAELLQQCLDAEFDEMFHERGNFRKRKKSKRYYWYFQWDAEGKKHERYAGPVTDKSVTDRVARFETIKNNYRARRGLVRALVASGLKPPVPPAGQVVEALWKAGFFRLRGVLVGTIAYSCYEGILGTRLAATALRTEDADFAQYWGVSENIGESTPPPLDVIRQVDETFRKSPHVSDPFVTTRYVNSRGFKVEFLTPNRGSDTHQDKPARMKALAETGAQPLRHLDYLIHQPEKSVMLHGGGVPVTIPRAERYAVHKLIVSVERRNQVKSRKDSEQASELIQCLSQRRPFELAEAWRDAWDVGPRWQEKLESGRQRLPTETQDILSDLIKVNAKVLARRRGRRRA